jgi:alkylation response protein AidB-like acyl-CoA dehydrogenase
MEKQNSINGGEWLIRPTRAQDVFIPEDFDQEQILIRETCRDFIQQEVYPHLEAIDSMQDPTFMPTLLDKAGELGLLGVSVPEAYGGFGKDFNTGMLVAEETGAGHSFAVAISAHTGIGTLPIVLYGNEAQKQAYLPKLASGEWKASYCLTEPNAGSDANSGKTKATLSPDGKTYLLNGQKMWITNAGFADLFVVFAKIDADENLSAFIVEKTYPGIRLNPEEKKMGIKGSSTRQVFFEDCPVPVENLLSERGNGFKIAVNILNIGRIKLSAASIGACKAIVGRSAQYANERQQFGRPIAKYGAIRYKLAEQVVRTFACESATYRASQNITDAIEARKAAGMPPHQAELKGVEEFAIECAMMKVHGSETLDYVVDEGVQIFGGMGYSAEAPMDRAYRDARINRIFEGTNEINRLLTVDMMLKRAMKGSLDLMGPAQRVAAELLEIPDFSEPNLQQPLETFHLYAEKFKKAVLLVAGAAVQKLMMELAKEQEILMDIADMAIETYVAESTLLRVQKLIDRDGIEAHASKIQLLNVLFFDTSDRLWCSGKNALCSFANGDELSMMTMGLKRFTKTTPISPRDARRTLAAEILEKNGYPY